MDAAYALLLGLIQGLTEFIPVSSTAHLRIAAAFLDRPDPGAAFSAVIQLGSELALLVYFRKDLFNFGREALLGLFSGKPFEHPAARHAWQLVIGTIPVSVAGLLLSDQIHGPFRSLYVVAGGLIVMALLLLIADRLSAKDREIDSITFLDAFLVGCAQAIALVPGASRSGSTLMMGLFLGFSRYAAMRFSFLLSIPAIGLSGLYELYSERDSLAAQGFEMLALGCLSAVISSYIAIAGLLHYLRSHSVTVFVIYRIALGLMILGLIAGGWLIP